MWKRLVVEKTNASLFMSHLSPKQGNPHPKQTKPPKSLNGLLTISSQQQKQKISLSLQFFLQNLLSV